MELIVNASLLAGIVLCLVGLIKLPLTKFKGQKFYKAGLTLLTIAVVIVACVLCELFIFNGSVWSVEMLMLTLITFGEVMLSYNGIYEGLGVKQIAKNLFEKVCALIAKTPENKLTKIANKYGIDEAIKHLTEVAEKKKAEEAEKSKPVEVQ